VRVAITSNKWAQEYAKKYFSSEQIIDLGVSAKRLTDILGNASMFQAFPKW
jgi:hypothetical protein